MALTLSQIVKDEKNFKGKSIAEIDYSFQILDIFLCGVVQPRAWMCDPVQSFFSFRDFVWVGRVGCSNRVPCRPSLKLDRTGLRQFLILYQVCNIFVQPLKSAPSKCKLCKQMRRRSRMTGQFLQYSFLSNFFLPLQNLQKIVSAIYV